MKAPHPGTTTQPPSCSSSPVWIPFSDIDAQFAGGHPNSVLNVFNGEISVGVSFDDARQDVYEEEETVGEEVVSRFHGCYLSAF